MNNLENLRTGSTPWESVAFKACQTDERGTFDDNASARLRALLALQYDRRESDVELIRHLFTNEIIAAENDSFQGCDSALTLAAFLLARFREPHDGPLFARAKLANFDTACGFPIEFVLFASGEQTENNIKASDPNLWDRLASSFDLSMTSDQLEEWWRTICSDYPDSEEDEHLLTLYERALSFDDNDRAFHYLEEWAAKEPDSEAKKRRLKYEYARLGDFKKAAEIAVSILDCAEELWDKASALLGLLVLQRKDGEFTLSLKTARRLDTTLASFDDWIGLGLGRMAIHEVFELSLLHPEVADAYDAFSLANRWFERSRDLALVGMESGAKAAQRCGLVDKANEYNRIAGIERKRIDDMMN